MSNKKEVTIIDVLENELKKRTNPTDLKPCIIGKIVLLQPLTVQISEGNILLEEGDELEMSEWFRFRCNIDATGTLSSTVPSDTDNAESITEKHSYSGAECQMPNAISSLASAILGVRDELLALKCIIKVGDYVSIASLEEKGKYILLDKVL